jgi:glycosyltransferase involved in cell wall biosynthesis
LAANDRPLLFDVSRLIWRRWAGRLPTGIDRVCLAYLARYRAEAQAVVHGRGVRRILGKSASDRLFDVLAASEPRFRQEFVRLLPKLLSPSSTSWSGKGRLYLNVGHTGLEEQGLVDWIRAADVLPIFLVHDLIPITHPEYCRAGEALRHTERIRNMLATAAGVVANSRATLESLAEFAAREQLPMPEAVAALLGVEVWRGEDEEPAAEPERPTFVMLGTIEARKNHLLLLQVWTRLARQLGPRTPRLLIIGQRGWECEQVVDLLERCQPLQGHVFEVGRCSDADLHQHLRTARALLFPSLVEGFGLPLIEALGLGTPVIASDLPVFREISPGIPTYLDPLDGPAWERTILAYADGGSTARGEQLLRLANYQPPSWNDHFAVVNDWLLQL